MPFRHNFGALLACAALTLSAARADDGPVRPPGQVLPVAPTVPPGAVAAAPSDPLALARERYHEGDLAGTANALTPWLESRRGPYGRERTAGHLLLGLAHMGLENWNLASANFYRVRKSGDPLAPYGAWYEAWVDHRRGRHTVAAAECAQYRQTWPDGPSADECLLLMADAYAAAGQRSSSLAAYRSYLDAHPDTPRDEEIRLGIALAEAAVAPDRAVPMLQDLVLTHSYHSTALAAQEALDRLAAQGLDTALPTDATAQMRQCESARRCGRFEEAWALFEQIAARADDDPTVAAWVERNEDRIAWGTRNYDVYAANLAAAYEAKPNADLAWRIFTAWSRAGNWPEAVAWARKAKDAHPDAWKWKRVSEDVAWAEMLAGNYAEARELWLQLGRTGGQTGKQAKFYAAFSAYRAQDFGKADEELGALAKDAGMAPAAYYWRAKARAAKGDEAGAAEDRALAAQLDRDGWYRLLLSGDAPAGDGWTARDGLWHGPASTTLPTWTAPEARPAVATGLWPGAMPLLHDTTAPSPEVGVAFVQRAGLLTPPERPAWGALRWPLTGAADADATAVQAPPLPVSDTAPPDGFVSCAWYDPVEADKAFARFADEHQDLWPTLPLLYDLTQAGLTEESSRLIFPVYEEWRAAQDGAVGPRADALRAVKLKIEEWRQLFLFLRDPYYASRFCYGLDKYADTDEDARAAGRLGYPIVRGHELWQYGRDYNLDPLLMMGIMRQESSYRSWALSGAGAVGLVQVMPITGARMAAALGETRYSPGDLMDPAVNLRYGAYYFSLLLKRFDGVFPLAVGAYNGGPHNISRWYRGWEGRIPLDVFVEQIQYPETRDYVKRVTGHYARYVALYGPPGSAVVLPPTPRGDDARVVDY